MSPDALYAYLWDHATHEMSGVYCVQAGVSRFGAMGKLWDALHEHERDALRVAIKGMLEAHERNRAADRSKQQAA